MDDGALALLVIPPCSLALQQQWWWWARLGILNFGSDFWDLHQKQNFDSVSYSGYSGRIFFENSAVENSSNRNSDLQNSEFHNFFDVGTKYISFCTYQGQHQKTLAMD
jgi:hypothetical protein